MSFESGRKRNSRFTIEGIIIPSKWDPDGNPSGVSIQTNDEKEYLVAITKTGSELLDHIHEKVRVKGKIRERLDGKTLIHVQEYRIVEEEFDSDAPWTATDRRGGALHARPPVPVTRGPTCAIMH